LSDFERTLTGLPAAQVRAAKIAFVADGLALYRAEQAWANRCRPPYWVQRLIPPLWYRGLLSRMTLLALAAAPVAVVVCNGCRLSTSPHRAHSPVSVVSFVQTGFTTGSSSLDCTRSVTAVTAPAPCGQHAKGSSSSASMWFGDRAMDPRMPRRPPRLLLLAGRRLERFAPPKRCRLTMGRLQLLFQLRQPRLEPQILRPQLGDQRRQFVVARLPRRHPPLQEADSERFPHSCQKRSLNGYDASPRS
jgi:hypothetical protein